MQSTKIKFKIKMWFQLEIVPSLVLIVFLETLPARKLFFSIFCIHCVCTVFFMYCLLFLDKHIWADPDQTATRGNFFARILDDNCKYFNCPVKEYYAIAYLQ